MRKPIIIGVCCHKGGVAKTATVAALADVVTYENNGKVLILDGDEQNCQKTIFGVKSHETQGGLASILMGEANLEDVKVRVRPNIDLVLSGGRFIKTFEATYTGKPDAHLLMKSRLGDLSQYDFVFIDSPPSISLINANIAIFADYVLVPCSPDLLAFVGLKQTINFFEGIGKTYVTGNLPLTRILGAVLTSYDERQKLDSNVLGDLEDLENSGLIAKCFSPIPKDIKVKTAQVRRKLLSEGFLKSKAFLGYLKLFQDMIAEIKRIESKPSASLTTQLKSAPKEEAALNG